MKDLRYQLPLVALLVVGGLSLAQNTTGRVFPYVGYLEEDGYPVNGERDLRVNLYPTEAAADACDTQYFSPVTVANGRFKVDVSDVPDACLSDGELYASIAVGPVGESLTSLSTGTGSGRVMIGAVPFAAASPKGANLLVAESIDVSGAVNADSAVIGGGLRATSHVVTLSGTNWTAVPGTPSRGAGMVLVNGGNDRPAAVFVFADDSTHDSPDSLERLSSATGYLTAVELEMRMQTDSSIEVRKNGAQFDGSYRVSVIYQQ